MSGMLANLLFRTALRAPGSRPVALSVDELATVARFVGSVLDEIVVVARSQKLRLLLACQHLGQLPDSLQKTLINHMAVQIFMRQSYADARALGTALAAGTPTVLTRVTISPEYTDRARGILQRTTRSHTVCDANGHPLRLDAASWQALHWESLFGANGVNGLYAHLHGSRFDRLYVRAADSGQPTELRRYTQGLAPGEYWFDGPAPLRLVISYPAFRLSGVDRRTEGDLARSWAARLQELPRQTAAVRLSGVSRGVVRITDVRMPAASAEDDAYIARALAVNGQSQAEIDATLQWREEQIERVARGYDPRPQGQANDGSIA